MSNKNKEQTIEESQVQDQINEIVADSQIEELTIEELTIEEQLTEDLVKEKDKFMRLFAEFENYKRRTTKERIDLFKTASEEVILSMLPVLDDFERALLHIEDDKEAEELRKGVLLIYNKLLTTLEKKGLTEIEVRQGDAFNADNHEAITQIPAPTDDLKGKIIDVIEKGYKLGEKVIRFPKVVIGQ